MSVTDGSTSIPVETPIESEMVTLSQTQLRDLIEQSVASAMRVQNNAESSSGPVSPEVVLSNTSSAPTVMVAGVSFKPPQPLFAQNPNVWFSILEHQFAVSKVVAETTKFSHAVSALDSRLHDTFADLILRDKGRSPYTTFKNEVIRYLGESEKTKLHNLLHGLSLGDSKPSQLLAKFKNNAGNRFSDSSLKQLWLKRLPQQVQLILTPFENDFSIDKLAERADDLMETLSSSEINLVHKTPERDTPSSSMLDLDDHLEKFKNKMIHEFTNVLQQHQTRSRTPKRSNSWNRRFRAKSNDNNNEMCSYHYRYGVRARKCLPFCKFFSTFSVSPTATSPTDLIKPKN